LGSVDSLEELASIDYSSFKSTWGDQEKYRSAPVGLNTLGTPGIFTGQVSTGGYAQSIGTTDNAFMINTSDAGLSNSYSLTSAMNMK